MDQIVLVTLDSARKHAQLSIHPVLGYICTVFGAPCAGDNKIYLFLCRNGEKVALSCISSRPHSSVVFNLLRDMSNSVVTVFLTVSFLEC
jgi:hypothetical protein